MAITRKQQLDFLISSNEEQKKKGSLTETGIAYLEGLVRARNIIFPEPKAKKRKVLIFDINEEYPKFKKHKINHEII